MKSSPGNSFERLDIQQQRIARREEQRRLFHRHQAIGLLLIAAAVLLYRLIHTPSGWIFPHGWWRL